MNGSMDGRCSKATLIEWMNDCFNGPLNEWLDGRKLQESYEWMDQWINVWMDLSVHGSMDGPTAQWIIEWIQEWMMR